MKWFLVTLSLIISTTSVAQSLCGPKINKFHCDITISSAISNKDNKLLEQLVAKKGVAAFLKYVDPTGYYEILETAKIFNNSAFISMITSRPDFSKEIIDKNRFLKTVLKPGEYAYLDPGMVNSLFNNKVKSKNLNWFEHSEWPYPMFKELKEENPGATHQELFKHLDKIDELKKNLCQITSVEKLLATEAEYPDFKKGLKYPQNDLLSCAAKGGNSELVAYLVKEGLYYPKNLTQLISYFEASPMTEKNVKLFKLIATQMRESKIPFPKSKLKQNKWTVDHWDDPSECSLQSNETTITEAKSFLDLSEKLIWLNYLQLIKSLRTALAQKNPGESAKAIKGIISLIKESGLSINYQDESGKTIMHHLAEFADFKTIETIERGLNDSNVTMDPTLQDKKGNSPLHIALLNQNIDGAYALADLTSPASDGFSSPVRDDVLMKNQDGKTPADLAKDLPNSDSKKKKEILEWIKRHTEEVKRVRK